MPSRKTVTLSLASLIAIIVLSACILLDGAFLFSVRQESNAAAMESAQTQFQEIASKTIARIQGDFQSISTLTRTTALLFKDRKPHAPRESLSENLPVMKHVLDANTQLLSAYVGYPDSVFYQVIAPRGNSQVLATYDAPQGTQYIERSIVAGEDGARRQSWRFLGRDLGMLSSRADETVEYDPRQRAWYKEATSEKKVVFTDPYVFSSSRLPGITCAHALESGDGVFGVDICLAQLSEMLATQRVARNGSLWVVDALGRLVAYPGMRWTGHAEEALKLPLAAESADPVVKALAGEHVRRAPGDSGLSLVTVGSKSYISTAKTMPEEFGLELSVVVAAPLSDITGPIDNMAFHLALVAAAVLVLVLPLALLLGRWASRPVARLVEEAEKIQRFDFSPSPEIHSRVREVNRLASASEVMKATIRVKAEGLIDTQDRLEKLVAGGLALSAEKDLAKLVSLIFQTARDIAKADGGVVYLKQDHQLGVEMLSLNAESLVLGGLSENPAPRVMVRPEILPFLSQNSVLRFACEAFTDKKIVTVDGVALSLFPTGLPEEPRDFAVNSLVSVPIITRRDEVLGVIQLFNPDLGGETSNGAPGDDSLARFVGSLAAQAAVTLDNRNLVNSLKELFDALIQVVASSIDAKSPYTSGHCARVPVLTEMLARAAHETDEGPLRCFRLKGEDSWRQLWVASWLHDCGKVTTPEYVVDKATKLETLYNRIHEVRMRFEVLRRDAEIAFLGRLVRGEGDPDDMRRVYEEELASLESDFAFLAKCNEGGEFMSDEDKDRVKAISTRTWMRHFSDRIGISGEETRLKGDAPEPELPATEHLLSDKPEHRIPRQKNYVNMVDAHGDPIQTPKHEYNRGEIHNLCISRGTLTVEEVFKIKEHTFIGLEMLSKIPFPSELDQVVDIAVSHHETLVGTGYPLKKTKEQLPMEARILAIADIFEALTASDRPYKKAKLLSEALRIMTQMREDQHIDSDLFDVFLQKGVFLQYARKYLDASQIDVTDASAYLSTAS